MASVYRGMWCPHCHKVVTSFGDMMCMRCGTVVQLRSRRNLLVELVALFIGFGIGVGILLSWW